MVSLTALWLAVLVSAIAVFVASSVIHMVLPYHRGDYKQIPDEDKILTSLRAAGLQRGVYSFPFCTHRDMKSEAILAKQKQGPIGMLTVFPTGPVNMPKYLATWFVFCVIVSFFAAYLAGHTIMPGVHHRAVLGVTGIAAFLAYGVGQLTNGIWAGQPWGITLKNVFDGLVYSVLTAGVFVWLWPH
jgi:hypothetical protein